MNLLARIKNSPLLVRVVPFVLFVGLTALQGEFGEASRYWIYFAKTLLGAAMLAVIWPVIQEMRWTFSWEAVAAGVLVFALWVGLDGFYPTTNELLAYVGIGRGAAADPTDGWNPFREFGAGSTLAALFFAVRLLGSTLVVPPLEEVFYRSFVYRYIAAPDFEKVSFGYFAWTPLLVTSFVFGFAHFEWLPGILCGLIYQGLVIWKKRLGDAITAHAITNFLLGLWVIWKGAWHFW